jgi:hypothetical protein
MATPELPNAGPSSWEIGIALATLVLSFVISAISGTWILARSRSKVVEKIDEVRLELERKINSKADSVLSNFGETISAAKQKMTDMELWNRDNFVSKQTFNVVMEQWRTWFTRFEDKIEKRFDRIDSKLDSNGQGGGK